MSAKKIPTCLMRGGTSKGLFFRARDLPADTRERDALLLRIMGSPDPYGQQIDGMGGANPSTSKVVIVAPSHRDDSDVDYLYGAVPIGEAAIDWSGTCDELSAAVGPFAIAQGWIKTGEPHTAVRIWQQNLQKRIIAHVPTLAGEAIEEGGFKEDGVAFSGAEISLEFLDPVHPGKGGLLPTGRTTDKLDAGELGELRVTLINTGVPTLFIRADAFKLSGRENPDTLNRDTRLAAKLELARAHAAVMMGLARTPEDATRHRPDVPTIVFIAAPAPYRSSSGCEVTREAIDLLARIVQPGKAHHSLANNVSIALAAAAALPGTVVAEVTRTLPGVPTRIGHASGVLAVGASITQTARGLTIEKVAMSRSARRLMEGAVYAPMPRN